MKKPKVTVNEQVMAIFRELVGDRSIQLAPTTGIPKAQPLITKALCLEHPKETAQDIAFHLTDWKSDAALIVALLLFPERFSRAQIRDGVEAFAIHAPNHVAAAAKLCGWPVSDIFEIDALDSSDQED